VIAADEDRKRTLPWRRSCVDLVEVHEAPVERRRALCLPETTQDVDVLVGCRATLFVRRVECGEFADDVADADAERQPASAQLVGTGEQL
jgi:hypothetical protein